MDSPFLQQTMLPLLGDHAYLLSFAVIASLLFAGQMFNMFRCRSAQASPTDQKVRVIIRSWWPILVFVFLAFWGGRYTAIPVFFLLTLLALREYAATSVLNDRLVWLFLAGAIGVCIHYAAFLLGSIFLFFTSIHLYALAVVMPFIVFNKDPARLPAVVAYYLSAMLLTVFLSYPVAVLVFLSDVIGSEPAARLAVLLLITLTEVNDIAQFTFGKLFGRNKVVPWVSPNKTEAGFIGGMIFSTLVGAVLWPRFLPTLGTQGGALLGFLLSIAGMIGDLGCSALKRSRHVKDFSDLIPGHGGAMDRVDSLVITAPTFFFFLYIQRLMHG